MTARRWWSQWVLSELACLAGAMFVAMLSVDYWSNFAFVLSMASGVNTLIGWAYWVAGRRKQ